MVRKIVRRKVRKPAGAGRKRVVTRKAQQPTRQPDRVVVIPGITGPIIPEAEAASMGFIRWVPAAKSIYRNKEMFGTTVRDKLGKKTTTLTAKQQAVYDKKQRYLKQHHGEFEYQSRVQHGLEKNFGDVPTNIFYSPKLKRMVALTGDTAPKKKIVDKKEVYPGAQKDWLDTQMTMISGPAEAGTGVSKTKGLKIIKDKNLDKKGKAQPMLLALWNWGEQMPRAGKYQHLSEHVGGMGRFQQSYVSGRFKPKKGQEYTVAMLPRGAGIQTEYVGWFDQPGRAATLRSSKPTKEGVVKKQTRVSVTKGKGTAKPAFKLRKHPVRIDDILKRSPTGKSKAVTSTGKFTKKQTKTGRHSLSTKKPFTRSARVGTLEGKGDPLVDVALVGDKKLDEIQLDKAFAKAVRGKHDFTKTLNLGVWRKLSIKQKSEVLKAAGVV